jgi:hypothetical protein
VEARGHRRPGEADRRQQLLQAMPPREMSPCMELLAMLSLPTVLPHLIPLWRPWPETSLVSLERTIPSLLRSLNLLSLVKAKLTEVSIA